MPDCGCALCMLLSIRVCMCVVVSENVHTAQRVYVCFFPPLFIFFYFSTSGFYIFSFVQIYRQRCL